MRALFFSFLLSSATFAGAQTCSQPSEAAAAKWLHMAQAKALAFEAGSMDSGVPPAVAPLLIDLKAALAEAADLQLACASPSETIAQFQAGLNGFLREAAPGLPVAGEPADGKGTAEDDLKPVKGLYGNQVRAKVTEFSGPPHLLLVTVSNSVTCGDDSQLLVYELKYGHWTRVLRWSADFGEGKGASAAWIAGANSAWGDFFLTGILTPDPTHPENWRAVVAHGSPWCTSRFSGFGLAVLAPSAKGEAGVIWQTDRGYSRGGDFPIRLKTSKDTFELRLHADEMFFNEEGFERLVVYRYRVSGDKVVRIEPVAAHARGFVEEWLHMPWDEALAQSDPANADKLKPVHTQYELSYKQKDTYTSWHSGPVQVCGTRDHFQVAMATERERIVPGKRGGDSTAAPTYYFQLQQGNGYRLLDITTTPDATCGGPDLMRTR